MERICVVTGAASGIGAATARRLAAEGCRVIASDLAGAEVIADLATPEGRAALAAGVARIAAGRPIDAVVANAGGGPPETSVQLNFFGAVATLEALRALMAGSAAPRAVAVSSIASTRPSDQELIEACLAGDEPRAIAAARRMLACPSVRAEDPAPPGVQAALDIYGGAKRALQRWCRRAAAGPDWAGAGIVLNVVALGFYDTPAASYVLSNPEARAAMSGLFPLKGSFPGHPDEAAALLAWCVSPQNSQMTGQILHADGGAECRLHRESLA
jgi:NAD(P)-dependent dehydrogenase (short-subunit alcohol dehydrogenase family)